MDAAPDAPTGPSCSTTSNSAAIQYYTQDMPPYTANGTIAFHVFVTNAGFSTLNLSDVTVRYWFTADGNALSSITFVSYYSSNGMGMDITKEVHGALMPAQPGNVTASSDSYLELSFGAGAGSIAALGGAAPDIQVNLHGTTYSDMFNQTNDYSFDSTKKSPTAAPWKAITAYTKGALVWGCEPGAGGSGSDAGVPAVDGGQPPVEAGQMPDASDAGSGG